MAVRKVMRMMMVVTGAGLSLRRERQQCGDEDDNTIHLEDS